MNRMPDCRLMLFTLAAVVGLGLFSESVTGQTYIVENGEPRAEIIIPEEAPDPVRFAATELQHYIERMTGATLPIVPAHAVAGSQDDNLLNQYPPDAERMPVRIFLGQSFYTDRLGLKTDDLAWGAYRMKSGRNWLALLGRDNDFIPTGIWGRNRGHWRNQAEPAWEQLTGEHQWGNPVGRKLWNAYNRTFDLWSHDQKGSLNAAYAFLRGLGVRWYMPGELGEIVPERSSIELPQVDHTVHPAFQFRKASFMRYGNGAHINPEILWSLRQGMNETYGYHFYHGLAAVMRPQRARENFPEFYALYNGQRDNESGTPNPCLSSEKLFEETVAYARFMFDHYNVNEVSVWPDDGYTNLCQCDKCEGKATPSRGRTGLLSNYVWEFVNRVAEEVEKTHPDKFISCGAYSAYWLPPTNMDRLHDNVLVYIVNARRRYNLSKEDVAARREAVAEWGRLADGKVITFMNYGGAANTPNIFAEDIKRLKGQVMGEDMWVAHERGGLANHAFYHLNYYVSSRLWWDIDQDVDALLAEYYDNFYGPAADQMRALIEYYETHQHEMRSIDSAPIIRKTLDLYEAAASQVEADSPYGQRIAMFSEGLDGIRSFYEKIEGGRENPPVFNAQRISGEIHVDGKLDEAVWSELPGTLQKIETGGEPAYPTRFHIGVQGNNLYVAIKCFDEPGNAANIAKVEGKDDSSLWYGDVVELLLETPEHSYYQIAISPAGAVCDLDREVRGLAKAFQWSAEAQVATQVNEAEGYWIVEARIPFTPSAQDPLHEIIGPTPDGEESWFFNVCRQRVRDSERTMSAFSPTGEQGFHNILTFGKLNVQ